MYTVNTWRRTVMARMDALAEVERAKAARKAERKAKRLAARPPVIPEGEAPRLCIYCKQHVPRNLYKCPNDGVQAPRVW